MFSFVILLLLFTISFAVRIEKLAVPELVQSGNAVVLDCQYEDIGLGDQVTVQWLFNTSELVYEWRPGHGSEPTVQGILEGLVDLNYKVSSVWNEKHSAIRVTNAQPEMTGDYTCRVRDGHHQANVTKTILVYSTEKEFSLSIHRRNSSEARCSARGLYPQPELTIEVDGATYPKQQQRVWRSEGVLYDAESTASIARRGRTVAHVTCRLQLPQAGYTAMKRETVCFEEICKSDTSSKIGPRFHLLLAVSTLILIRRCN